MVIALVVCLPVDEPKSNVAGFGSAKNLWKSNNQ